MLDSQWNLVSNLWTIVWKVWPAWVGILFNYGNSAFLLWFEVLLSWFCCLLPCQQEEPAESSEEGQDGEGASGVYSEWQAQLVKKMKGVGLGSTERSPTLTKSRSSPALGGLSSRDASQTLWEFKVLDSRLPNGFYSVIPVSWTIFQSISDVC